MKRSPLVSRGSLNRTFQDARAAWNEGDYQKCFELLERASRLDPANVQILLNLGQCYGLRWQYADAERCFEKAARIAPLPAEVLAAAGRLAAEFYHPPLAEKFFQQALLHRNVRAETVARLAELYEHLNRAEDAANMTERALQMDPACALARLTLAKLHRQAGRLSAAEQALRPILNTADRELRARGYYELGTIHDRQEQFDEAMSAFATAKTVLKPTAAPVLAQLQTIIGQLKEMQDNVSADMLGRWFESSREQLQPLKRMAFLGGHARSGTTLLEQVLDSHPDIVSAEETTIFHNEAYATLRRCLPNDISMLSGLDSASIATLRLGRERYFHSMAACLNGLPGQPLLIDKNPSLQALIITFIRFFPEARLLIALRDPRDVVMSCYMLPHWLIGTGNVTFLELESTVRTYARCMGIWQSLKLLLINPWLEIRYEDMIEDLQKVARKTLDFLGMPWDDQVLAFDHHARHKAMRSPTYADVTQPIYKRARGRWRNYQKYLEPHLASLDPFVKAFGYE